MKKYETVIFDLFGTLVPYGPLQENRRMIAEIASVLSIDSEVFSRLWSETLSKRMEGIRNFRENVEYICQQVGSPIEDQMIELASKMWLDMARSQMVPRADTVEVLSSLRSGGYKTGLISDCSYEATIIWRTTPLATLVDVPVFSCSVGLQKPDPRIYQTAMKRLDVEPHHCLYIGDGGSQELTGASKVGMQALMLRIPSESDWDVYREKWDGPVISSLKEVLALVKE